MKTDNFRLKSSIFATIALIAVTPANSEVLFQWQVQCIEQYNFVMRNGATVREEVVCSQVPEIARIITTPFLGFNPYTGESISNSQGELRIQLLGPTGWSFNRNLGYWSDSAQDWTFNIYTAEYYYGTTWSGWQTQIDAKINPVSVSWVESAQGIHVTAGNIQYGAEWGAYIATAVPIPEPSTIALWLIAAPIGVAFYRRQSVRRQSAA